MSVTVLSKYYILGREKGNLKKKNLELEELDAQHYVPCTLNCMYVFYHLLLWTVNADFIWTVTLIFIVTVWTFVNGLWINLYATYFDKQTKSLIVFVFKYSKITCFLCNFSVQNNHFITLVSCLTVSWTYLRQYELYMNCINTQNKWTNLTKTTKEDHQNCWSWNSCIIPPNLELCYS